VTSYEPGKATFQSSWPAGAPWPMVDEDVCIAYDSEVHQPFLARSPAVSLCRSLYHRSEAGGHADEFTPR
jgi:hypothetical protein